MRPYLGLLLFLCACARIPDHKTATAFESSSCNSIVEDSALALGEWPTQKWWQSFQDETLNTLIEQALELSPTLKKAEEVLKAAFQAALQKRSALFPEINFDADDNWQHLAKNGFFRAFAPTIPMLVNDIHFGFSYAYEFDFWGKNRSLFKAALGERAALAGERSQAELILTTSVAYTYLQLQLLLHQRSLTAGIEKNREEIEKTREKRHLHALDTLTITLQSKAEKLEESSSLIELDQQIETLLHKLKALSGLGQDAELKILKGPIRPISISLPENLALDLLARRPDLTAQKMRMEAAAKEIEAARTDFYPNLNLMGGVGFETVFWSLFQKKNYNGNINPAIHLPIFTAGRLKAQLLGKVAEFNSAVYSYNELILQAAQEVADAVSKIVLLQKEIEIRKISSRVAEAQKDLCQKRVINALDNHIDLLRAKNNSLEMQKKLIEVELGSLLASIQLIRSLGGGFHE